MKNRKSLFICSGLILCVIGLGSALSIAEDQRNFINQYNDGNAYLDQAQTYQYGDPRQKISIEKAISKYNSAIYLAKQQVSALKSSESTIQKYYISILHKIYFNLGIAKRLFYGPYYPGTDGERYSQEMLECFEQIISENPKNARADFMIGYLNFEYCSGFGFKPPEYRVAYERASKALQNALNLATDDHLKREIEGVLNDLRFHDRMKIIDEIRASKKYIREKFDREPDETSTISSISMTEAAEEIEKVEELVLFDEEIVFPPEIDKEFEIKNTKDEVVEKVSIWFHWEGWPRELEITWYSNRRKQGKIRIKPAGARRHALKVIGPEEIDFEMSSPSRIFDSDHCEIQITPMDYTLNTNYWTLKSFTCSVFVKQK